MAGRHLLLWYPIKEREDSDTLARRLRRSAIAKVLRAEVGFAGQREPGLAACGLIVVNPPWTLEGELEVMLPALANFGRTLSRRLDRARRRMICARSWLQRRKTLSPLFHSPRLAYCIGLALTFRLLWGPAE